MEQRVVRACRRRSASKRNGMPMFRAVAHPATRTQLLIRWMMFPTLVRCSQFDE